MTADNESLVKGTSLVQILALLFRENRTHSESPASRRGSNPVIPIILAISHSFFSLVTHYVIRKSAVIQREPAGYSSGTCGSSCRARTMPWICCRVLQTIRLVSSRQNPGEDDRGGESVSRKKTKIELE